MQNIRVGPWNVEADPESTAQVHERIRVGGPEDCGCGDCRNFAAARELAYPEQANDLFRALGIRRDRETEVTGPVALEDGRLLYSGWFHFVGRILEGPVPKENENAVARPEVVSKLRFHPLTEGFGVLLRPGRDLLPKEFGKREVVQLDFSTEIPWVLAEPPESAGG
jgi:hypothetical protein